MTDPAANDALNTELVALRASIDNLDAAVIYLLSERFKCTQRIGALKPRMGLPSADPERESYQVTRLRRLALEANLDPDFAEKLLNFIIQDVIRHHERQRGKDK